MKEFFKTSRWQILSYSSLLPLAWYALYQKNDILFATFTLFCYTLLVFGEFLVWRRNKKNGKVSEMPAKKDTEQQHLQVLLLKRFIAHGPECVNQLSVELCIPNNRIQEALQALYEKGLASKRRPRFFSCARKLPEGEERWGAF